MSQIDVIEQLKQRFAEPLGEYAQRRIVVWHDAYGEFEEQFDDLAQLGFDDAGVVDGVMPASGDFPRAVRFVKAEDGVMFTVKRLVNRKDTTNDILLYRKQPRGVVEGDWLADVELYADHFQADYFSLLASQIGAADSGAVREALQKHKKFFAAQTRIKHFSAVMLAPASGEDVDLGILAVLLGATQPEQANVAYVVRAYLQLLMHSGFEESQQLLAKFNVEETLAGLVARRTGFQGAIAERDSLSEFAAHLLLTAASHVMPEGALSGLEAHIAKQYAPFCLAVVKEWDREPSAAEDLFEVCRLVESECGLPVRFAALPLASIMECDVFPCVNEALLQQLFASVAGGSNRAEEARAVLVRRKDLAWYGRAFAYFEMLEAAIGMQEFEQKHAGAFGLANAQEVWAAYTQDWWHMDMQYRKLCVAYSACQKAGIPALEEPSRTVVDWAEGLYENWFLAKSCDCWTNAASQQWEAHGFVGGVPQQRKFLWETLPEYSDMKTTVVVVSDALRYEVACEIAETLNRERGGKVKLGSMQATFPTVTEFGMPALLPQKTLSLNWEQGSVLADDKPTATTEQREAVLQTARSTARALRASQYLEMPSAQRKALLKDAGLVYLYHNKIDATGEKPATEQDVFDACADTVEELCALACRVCADVPAARVVITADHGFLYTRHELEECQRVGKSALPEAEAISGKRHMVAQSAQLESWFGANNPDAMLLIRMNMDALGGGEYVGLAPRQSVRIKRPGGTSRYVHGGVSLQEMCVPVVGFRKVNARSKEFEDTQFATLRVLDDTRRITNSLFRIKLIQNEPAVEKTLPCEYELAFTDVSGNEVSTVVKAHADRASENPQDRVLEVQFNLRSDLSFSAKDLYYLVARDKKTGAIAWREEYRIEVSFAPIDFGF